MAKTKKTEPKMEQPLPPGVVASDLKWPAFTPWRTGDRADWPHELTYYLIGGSSARKTRDWVIATLKIGGARNGFADRTYAVQLSDGKVCRVGRGPHVLAVVTVYLSAANADRLAPHVELWRSGQADAGAIRDRISTRRAQGQLHRAAGRTHWYW